MVLGAASQVGYRVLPLLNDAAINTLAVSRKKQPAWSTTYQQVDWLTPEQIPRVTDNIRAIISAGPLPLVNKIQKTLVGVQQIIALSSASVEFKIDSGDRDEQRQMSDLLNAERQLQDQCAADSVSLTIFPPTMIYGEWSG